MLKDRDISSILYATYNTAFQGVLKDYDDNIYQTVCKITSTIISSVRVISELSHYQTEGIHKTSRIME